MSVEAISWALNLAPAPAGRGGQPSRGVASTAPATCCPEDRWRCDHSLSVHRPARNVRLPAGDLACGGSGGGRLGRPPPVVVLERAVTGRGRVDPLRAPGRDVEVDRD